jgi:uncharacterized protein (TIGR03437 family)
MLLLAASLSVSAQTGRYFARHVYFTSAAPGSVSEARSYSGLMVFDGKGGYTLTGLGDGQTVNTAGAYASKSGGFVTISNPLRPGATINARIGQGMIVGSTTETAGVFDVFAAVAASSASIGNGAMKGDYALAAFSIPAGNLAQIRSAFGRVTFSGAGVLPAFTFNGLAANLGQKPVSQNGTEGRYNAGGEMQGTLSFPLIAGLTADQQLVIGEKTMAVAGDGSLFIAGGVGGGSHDIIIGVKTPGSLSGLFWGAGIRYEAGRFSNFTGAASATGSGRLVWSQRVRVPEGGLDFTGANSYSLGTDGTGLLELTSLGAGAAGTAFAGANASALDANRFEILFGIRAPVPTGSGVYLNPLGVVNAASFAPAGAPVAPGEFITLFGNGLANSSAVASTATFPLNLAGVEVLINEQRAPVYAVSPTQISALVPLAAPLGTATIVVSNSGTRSNPVEAVVGAAAPGIFTLDKNGLGSGAILRADYTLVSPQSPVRRGEYVLIFCTGLGRTSPPSPDGTPGPSSPLSTTTIVQNVYFGGRKGLISYQGLAPGFAGLYQLNVRVPADAPTGGAIPVAIETAESFHDQADIAIRQ